MNKETGGPAFPCDHLVDEDGVSLAPGMTLRDYFAAKAMQPLVLLHHEMELGFAITAADAYRMADAMIKARNNNE